jgi:hypothetical protein
LLNLPFLFVSIFVLALPFVNRLNCISGKIHAKCQACCGCGCWWCCWYFMLDFLPAGQLQAQYCAACQGWDC